MLGKLGKSGKTNKEKGIGKGGNLKKGSFIFNKGILGKGILIAIGGILNVGKKGIAGKVMLGKGKGGGKGMPGILNGSFGNFGSGMFIFNPGMFIFGKLSGGISGRNGSLNGNANSGSLGGNEKGILIGIERFSFTLNIVFWPSLPTAVNTSVDILPRQISTHFNKCGSKRSYWIRVSKRSSSRRTRGACRTQNCCMCMGIKQDCQRFGQGNRQYRPVA